MTISLLLFIIFVFKHDVFIKNLESVSKYLGKKEKIKNESLFRSLMDYMWTIFCVLFMIIIFLWIEYHTSRLIVWIFSIGSLVAFILLFPENYNNLRSLLIIVILFGGLLLLFLLGRIYIGATILTGLVLGISLVIKIDKIRKNNKINLLEHIKLPENRFVKLIKIIHELEVTLKDTIKFKNEILGLQALVISIIIVLYILWPRIEYLFPENVILQLTTFKDFLKENKDHIAFMMLFIYITLSITLSLTYIGDYYKSPAKGFKVFIYKAIVFLMMILFSIPYTLIVFIAFSIIVAPGYYLFGIDFALLLSFFVFPSWVSRLHSYFICIFLLALPAPKFMKVET